MIRFKKWFFARVRVFLTAMALIGFSPLSSAETRFGPIAVLSEGNPFSPRVTLAAVTKVEIVAPSSVAMGETFEAMVENPVEFIVWTCDPSRLRRLDSNNKSVRFHAVSTGTAWVKATTQSGSAQAIGVISGEHTTKPGKTSAEGDSPKKAMALIKAVRSKGMKEMAFFNEMGEQKLTVKNLMDAKAEIINRYASQTKPLALACCFQKSLPNCEVS